MNLKTCLAILNVIVWQVVHGFDILNKAQIDANMV